MRKGVKYVVILISLTLSLSGCIAGQIVQKVIHPSTPSADSAAVMEAYDSYMTMLFKGYTLQDFRFLNEHWEKIANMNPYSIGSPAFETYRIFTNTSAEIGDPKHYKPNPINGFHPLLQKQNLPNGGFYICARKIYDLPFKLKKVMYFVKHAQNCDPLLQDYCPDMTIKKALQQQIWQNNATVFIFGKDGSVQKVVTAYQCPPSKYELSF